MHLLAVINNNLQEWRALQLFDPARPRLPIPYMLGGAFLASGHSLSAFDSLGKALKDDPDPFQAIYYRQELKLALSLVDIAVLWGGDALKTLFRQAIHPGSKRNVLYFSYSFASDKPGRKQRALDLLFRGLVRTAGGLVLMTGEQTRKARLFFGEKLPVIRLRTGIDTAFYRAPVAAADVPEDYRGLVDKLLSEPYVVLPGDELRLNDDAIRLVKRSGIRLVRISQYRYKSGTDKLKAHIAEQALGDRLLVFERIEYSFLRFLLRHASAYVGLVDSSWQPAGWTVACEALASGLPMVLYDGLVSRELAEAGAPSSCVLSVPMRDVAALADKFTTLLSWNNTRIQLSDHARTFAQHVLDFEITAPAFVAELERLASA